jgi:hypothetical protein
MKTALIDIVSRKSIGSSNEGWPRDGEEQKKKEVNMLWTILVILLILWLVGLLTANTFGGLIHILLVIAVIVLVVRLLQGKKIL